MTLRILISMLFAVSAFAQAPIQRNSFTTNSPGKIPTPLTTTTSTLYPLMTLDPSGVGTVGISYSPVFRISNGIAMVTGNFQIGALSGGGIMAANGSKQPFIATIGAGLTYAGGTLSANASGPATNTQSTTIVTNNYVENAYIIKGSHNIVIISNELQILNLKTNLLAVTADGHATNANYGAGIAWDPATLTISSTATGSGLDTSVTALGWSGTNLTGFDCATNGATFKVTLTNNAFLADSTFANLPAASAFKFWTLQILEDSTGGWTLNATNTVVRSPGGVFPTVSTNANSITVYGFYTSTFTNAQLIVGPQIFGVQ